MCKFVYNNLNEDSINENNLKTDEINNSQNIIEQSDDQSNDKILEKKNTLYSLNDKLKMKIQLFFKNKVITTKFDEMINNAKNIEELNKIQDELEYIFVNPFETYEKNNESYVFCLLCSCRFCAGCKTLYG